MIVGGTVSQKHRLNQHKPQHQHHFEYLVTAPKAFWNFAESQTIPRHFGGRRLHFFVGFVGGKVPSPKTSPLPVETSSEAKMIQNAPNFQIRQDFYQKNLYRFNESTSQFQNFCATRTTTITTRRTTTTTTTASNSNQQQPTTTDNNQQQPTTTHNNNPQQQPTTTTHNNNNNNNNNNNHHHHNDNRNDNRTLGQSPFFYGTDGGLTRRGTPCVQVQEYESAAERCHTAPFCAKELARMRASWAPGGSSGWRLHRRES